MSPLGIKNGDGYDWGAVAADLSRMMTLADEKVKEGSLLDAAEIARYVMTLTCAEYEADHPYGETYGEVWWLRRKPLKEVLERARVMLTELLISGERLRVGDGTSGMEIDDDSQRGLMKEIVVKKPAYDIFVELFHLRERYEFHKMEGLLWLELKYRYTDSRIAMMANSLHDADFSVRRIKDDIFQRQLDERERCFEKLKRDILK